MHSGGLIDCYETRAAPRLRSLRCFLPTRRFILAGPASPSNGSRGSSNRSWRTGIGLLASRAAYLLGLCHLRFGRHAAVIASSRRAAELAGSVGDRVLEISARSEIADAFSRLALPAPSWRERVVILQLAERLADRTVSHITLAGASRSAASDGQWAAAEAFAVAMLRNAEEWQEGPAQAEAKIRLADIAHRGANNGEAAVLLDDADRLLAAMPDRLATNSKIEVEMLRAAVQLEDSPAQALVTSERAFEFSPSENRRSGGREQDGCADEPWPASTTSVPASIFSRASKQRTARHRRQIHLAGRSPSSGRRCYANWSGCPPRAAKTTSCRMSWRCSPDLRMRLSCVPSVRRLRRRSSYWCCSRSMTNWFDGR